MKLKLGIHSQDIRFYINCVYCLGRIRTLVVMETFSFHRLIMGKLKIDIFSCLNGDICNIFYREILLSSPLRFIRLLSKLLNLFGCQGNRT